MAKPTRWAENGTMDLPLKKAIRHYRIRRGRTQEFCAAEADMDAPRRWSDLEREKGRVEAPSFQQLQAIADAVGATPAEILRKAGEFRGS